MGEDFGPDEPFPALKLEGVTEGESNTDPSETGEGGREGGKEGVGGWVVE